MAHEWISLIEWARPRLVGREHAVADNEDTRGSGWIGAYGLGRMVLFNYAEELS